MDKLTKLSFVFMVVALVCVTAVSQSSATPSSTRVPPTQNQQPPIDQSSSPAIAQPAYLTPIAGYQGVLAETVEGTTIAAQAADERFNPASSVKLATTLVALQTLGPEHKFITGIWVAGPIDKSTGTLNGDLVLTGRDPSLHYEHAVMVARQLNQLGIRTITGKLIVTPSFTMNFDWSAKHSGEMFRDTLDAARRSAAATRAWLDERTLIGDNASLSSVPSIVINGDVEIGTAPPGAVPVLTHKSTRLLDVLKALLCYSNNFMAERIGDGLGGPEAISATLTKQLNLNPGELSLASTSGVGVNRVTPRAMMKVLRALRDELASIPAPWKIVIRIHWNAAAWSRRLERSSGPMAAQVPWSVK
jgi:D-alanyl-D-alanine carboxypeptidase/D-alanyl-D-alanine-endopeptidase (penicillin-binding protein 4)